MDADSRSAVFAAIGLGALGVYWLYRRLTRVVLEGPMQVTALYVYPVKSCRGYQVKRAKLDRLGLEWDRRFMVVREDTGMMVTMRAYPRMGKVAALVEEEEREEEVSGLVESHTNTTLVLSHPDMETLRVPLRRWLGGLTGGSQEADGWFDGEKVASEIWDQVLQCPAVGKVADEWFSKALGLRVRLVAAHTATHDRHNDPRYDLTPPADRIQSALSDGFPLLLATESSLAEVNRRLPACSARVPMEAFRPNIVVAGDMAAFNEDYWSRISVEGLELDIVKQCARCVMPTVDPVTCTRRKDQEPSRTLRSFRRVGDEVYFGQNVLHTAGGELQVGQAVAVVKRHEEGLAARIKSMDAHFAGGRTLQPDHAMRFNESFARSKGIK